MTWGAVKGQDERPLFGGALDSSPRHHRRVMQMKSYADEKQLIKEGRHVGLDFYDLLIEGHYTQNPCSGHFGCNRDFSTINIRLGCDFDPPNDPLSQIRRTFENLCFREVPTKKGSCRKQEP